ncbi:NADH-quinone oxidoreductase subunit NuoF [Rhizobium sp. FKY42]|uniref:NADH-quinone oxidoreductase subunit NuoF n=1 Tax=Rhizobium sp. FKY42 TaxID=2562310 RepID=UPI0010C066FE|nr:NADH-quinone oxidoreductase subunit NuoF [Rhizobium sp. FKY42]
MLEDKDRIFRNLDGRLSPFLESAQQRSIWSGTEQAFLQGPQWVIDTIKASGLRGRGGAGTPTGLKWDFMPKKEGDLPHYLVVNADESEPGACKDRDILRYEPHLLIEGAFLASYAIGARTCYIYVRGEYVREREILDHAIAEAYAAKLIGQNNRHGWDFDIRTHHGAGAYVCGEETALLESLEGRKGMPRLRPPYPAACGLYGCPTIVNNVESIAVVGTILRRGAIWFAGLGTPNNAGTKIFSISGHVNRPRNVEEVMGIPLRSLLTEGAGGVRGGWQNLKAVMPGGGSTPMIPASIAAEALMDYDSMKKYQTALGSGSVIVLDKSTDLVAVVARLSKFYAHESCGQCTPCREGTGWLWRVMKRMAAGEADISEIDMLLDVASRVEGHTICGLGDFAAWPIQGLVRHFRHEIEEKIHRYRAHRASYAMGGLTPACTVSRLNRTEIDDVRHCRTSNP